MLHARSDYNRIQDPSGKIPADEPVFLLRAQDKFAATLVRIYAQMLRDAGISGGIVTLCKEQAQRMDAWPVKKMPDIPAPIPHGKSAVAVEPVAQLAPVAELTDPSSASVSGPAPGPSASPSPESRRCISPSEPRLAVESV